jgi:lipoate---protein ligase
MAEMWRWLPPLTLSGDLQMALDAWLLDRCRTTGESVLRFYEWAEPTISLGWHQRTWPQHWRSPTPTGEPLHLVRRPSGGRAVLHQGDLSYAVVTPSDLKQRRAVCCQLSRFLVAGFQQLQVELRFGQGGRGYIGEPGCFSTATTTDLVLPDGRKLIGSAQLWRGPFVLQHGTIQIQPNATLWHQVFGPDCPLPRGPQLTPQELIPPLRQAAENTLGIELIPLCLSASDWQAITALKLQFKVEGVIGVLLG